MKLSTITTLELSNVCNLNCLYCVNRLLKDYPKRVSGIMTDKVFDKSLELIAELCLRGTQKEVNMHGNGESTLDPKLIERIGKVRNVVGDRDVFLCTNGLSMTEDLAKSLKDSGLTRCDVSPHSPFHARKAISVFRSIDMMEGELNLGSMINTHNWAGQLEPENSVDIYLDNQCDPLLEGRGYVLTEGNITPCCYDYRNLGVFGSVSDSDILEREVKPYVLCKTCHQEVKDD